MNAIMVVHPYTQAGIWVFDDAKVGLLQEPFVDSAGALLDRMTAAIPEAERGFTMLFSAQPFPGHQAVFERRREEYGGWWYFSPAHAAEGWLCPALFRYFEAAPERIYAQAKPRQA